VLYFAYGSNMDWEQMRDRCPSAQFLFKATLKGYTMAFTHQRINNKGGAADVVECADSIVWGVVYSLEDSDLPGLYRSEGFQPGRTQNSYAPVTVIVHPDNVQNRALKVSTFTVCRKLAPHQQPSREYLDRILAGARHWNLPGGYRETLERIETRP
jgi:hypothetical protein